MALLNEGRVDIISRDNGTLVSQANGGYSHNVLLAEPSVVKINGTRAMVVEFERQGNDLILHMRDGSVVRYQQFFFDDVDGEHSELVFDDGVNPPEHALFPVTAEASDATLATVITPTYESMSSLEPLLLADNQLSGGVITAAGIGLLGLAGIAIGAGGGGGGGGGDNGGGNPPPEGQTPTITINPFTGDAELTPEERQSAQTLSGTTTNAEAGSTVTIILNNKTYTTLVQADGSWSLSIPAADLAALQAGDLTLRVSVTNGAGNSGEASQVVDVLPGEGATPTITIAPFTGDAELTPAERQNPQTLSGTTTNAEVGSTVTIVLNNKTYTTQVKADGSWSVSIPAADLAALASGETTLRATVTNAEGNSASASQVVDVLPPDVSSIALAPISGDGFLNAQESQSPLTLNGNTSGVAQGSVVTLTFNGQTYTAIVGANGSWSTSVPASVLAGLRDGTLTVTASVTDTDGRVINTSGNVTVAIHQLPNVSINEPFGDGVLNGQEAGVNQTISGRTGLSGAGQTVTITLNGVTYTGTVDANGNWKVTLPTAALQQLAQGDGSFTVTVTDRAGNSSTGTENFTVDTSLPPLTLNPIAGDNILNGAEKALPLQLSGRGEAGDSITVTLNGKTYTTVVGQDGSWSLNVPTGDLALMKDGSYPVKVIITDAVGNTTTQTSTITVDATPPQLALNNEGVISGDGYLNATERGQPLNISGTSEAGSTITVTLDGKTYNVVVGSNGQWTVSIPASDLAALTNGDYTINVTATDKAGNVTASPGHSLTVIADPGSVPTNLTVNPFAGDDVVNGAEQKTTQSLSGHVDNARNGSQVVVTLAGKTYNGTVDASGNWHVDIPASALEALANGSAAFQIVVRDPAGNQVSGSHNFTVDSSLGGVAINPISGDGFLNAQEAGQGFTISGSTSGVPAGRIVSVSFNGKTYQAEVGSNGAWTLNVPASDLAGITDGIKNITATTTDAAGNTVTASGALDVIVNTLPNPTLEPPFGDGALNGSESQTNQTLSGSTGVTGAGQTVTVTLGGKTYTGVVDSDGNWSVGVPAGALQALPQGNNPLQVIVKDAAGNTTVITNNVTVDTQAPALVLNPIAGDGIINSAEHGQALNLTGRGEVGAVVTVTLDGVQYTGTVGSNGQWTVTVPATAVGGLADGNYPVKVVITDAAGNATTQNSAVAVETAPPTFTVSPIAGDGIVNGAEQGQPLVIKGTGSAGDKVTVTLDGQTYTATVGENGQWSVSVPASALKDLPQGEQDVSIGVVGKNGNTASETQPVTVDTTPPDLTLNPVSGGYINASEHTQPLAIGGTGDAGDKITVTLNGKTYTTTVAENGSWSVTVPVGDVTALADGNYPVTVRAQDSAGNTTDSQASVTVIANPANLPTLTVNDFTSNNVLDGAEQKTDQILSGTTTHVQAGQIVTVTLNGQNYTAVVEPSGAWHVTLPAAALQALQNGSETFTVRVTDAAGNPVTSDKSFEVNNNASAVAIDIISDDGYLNAGEAGAGFAISGTTQNVPAGNTVTVTFNGKTYTAEVGSDGNWTLTVPPADLVGISDGEKPITATVNDGAGNPVTANGSVDVIVNTLPDPTLQPPFGDGVLSGSEAGSDQTLTGSTGVKGDGQTVTVIIGGVSYEGSVDAQGNWSVTLPSDALQNLPQGQNPLQVVVGDAAGNTGTLDQNVTVSTGAPLLAVNPLTGDDILNAAERGQTLQLTGGTEPGSKVVVTINGQDYNATVGSSGLWSLAIPPAVWQGMADGKYDITVKATSSVGNTVTVDHPISLDTTPPAFTLAPLAGDGVLNAAEIGQPLNITGSATQGDVVTVLLNGKTYTVTVGESGQWSIPVPAADLAGLKEGVNNATVTVTDPAGNSATQSGSLVVDTQPPALNVGAIAGDGILNSAEQGQPLAIGGTGEAGARIVVTLNGKDYSATVGNDGKWSVSVPQADLAALSDQTYPVSVTATDTAGNSTTQSSSLQVAAGAGSQPGITVDAFAGNDVLDGAEQQVNQVLSGSTTRVEAGQIVTVTLNGNVYSGVVDSSGHWKITVPASALSGLANGEQTLVVSVIDKAGNSAQASHDFDVNNTLSGLAVDPISGDGYLNASEAQTPLTISGSSINIPSGNNVTVSINGTNYTAAVGSDGKWSLTLTPAEQAALPEGPLTITVTATDAAGNPVTSETTLTVAITTQPVANIDPPFGDGTLNGNEANSNQTLTGSTGVSGPGQTVVVTIGGKEYNGTVDGDGNWSVNVPGGSLGSLPQGSNDVTVKVGDAAGNSNSSTTPINVDTQPPAVAITTPIAGDGVLNASEQGNPLIVGGTGENGSTVQVTLGGNTYTATVGTNGQWSVTVPAADLQALADGSYSVGVTATDPAGNSSTVSGNLQVKADPANLPTLTVDAFAGNDILDGAEQRSDQRISGTTTHVEAGQTVTVTLNGKVYTTQVQASGNWSLNVPTADLQALNNGSASLTVAVSDKAGNPVTGTHDFTVNNALSGLAVDPVSGDGYLNATEARGDLPVSGTSANLAAGAIVTITFNNQTFTAEVGADGKWSAVIPAASLAGLQDGPANIAVSATDQAGNPVTSSGTVNVAIHQLPSATLNPPFGDGKLNASEQDSAQTLSGKTGIAGDGQTVTVTLGGNSFTGTVDSNGNWQVNLPAGALDGLNDGSTNVVVVVKDAAGNSSTVTAPVVVDTTAPTLTLNPIAGDGRVNGAEAQQAITISGEASGAEAGQRVTVTINGQSYTTAVGANGGWSLDLPAGLLAGIANGSYTLTASVSDAAGNPASVSVPVTVATSAPVPTLNLPFGDGYLNQSEAGSAQTLTGSTGLAGAGQSVVITLGGNDYTATVDANGNWSLALSPTVLQGLGDGSLPIVVTATDAAGNKGTANSSVTVDKTPPTLSLDPVASDNIINAAESMSPITLSGKASVGDAGQTVTLTFNGQTYQALVQNDGSWHVDLPTNVVQALADGNYNLGYSLTDKAGNTTTGSSVVRVDANTANLPAITVGTVSGDDYINRAESGQNLTLSGTTTHVEAGRTVNVTLNGKTYTATVAGDGSWTLTVPAADVGQLANGAQTITASVSDAAGNPASASHGVTVVASGSALPSLTISPIAGDDVINAQEANSPVIIRGTSTHLQAGATVTVSLNGKTYTGLVQAVGSWSASVPSADVKALSQGQHTVTANANDVAANPASASHNVDVDTTPPLLQVTAGVGADGILNLAEALAGLVIGGKTDAGLTVTVTLNGKTYNATANAQGDWSLRVPSGDLLLLADGQAAVDVKVTDSHGNTTDNVVNFGVAINALPVLTLAQPFVDGILNAAELGAAQVLSGTATHLAVGTVVTVKIGDATFTGTVQAGGTWQVNIPAGGLSALLDGTVQLQVSAQDPAGNPASVSGNVEVIAKTVPDVSIDTPFGDGALNLAEAQLGQVITGLSGVTGDGQTIRVTIGSQTFNATIDSKGQWQVALTAEQLLALGNGTHTVTVTVTDRAGNSDSTSLDFNEIVTGLPAPTLNTPFTDGLLNAAEAAAGGALSGVTGITGAQTVIVNINGTAYSAQVNTATGAWTLALTPAQLAALPDGNWPIAVSVTDGAGNVGTANGSLQVHIHDLPDASINLPFTDGLLNIVEAAAGQVLAGSTGTVGAGQTVTVTIAGINGGNPLTATVNANGDWTLNLTPAQLQGLANGSHTITVNVTDAAGNTDSVSTSFSSQLTALAPVIDTPFGDGVLNLAEANGALTLTGKTGVTGANQSVKITIDVAGVTYTGTVDSNGNWSVPLPAGALKGLDGTSHEIIVNIIDSAGNTATATLPFTSNFTLPVPTIATPFTDGFLNAVEVGAGGNLTGTTGVTGSGQTVRVTVGGTTYNATVGNDGNWTLALTPAQLGALGQGDQTISVTATNGAGNSATATGHVIVDTQPPSITINPITGDNVLTYAESLTSQVLSGTTTGVAAGQTVTISLGLNPAAVTAIVQPNGTWSVNLTPVQLALLGTGLTGDISVRVTDTAGNPGTASSSVSLNLTPPLTAVVTIAPISGDNIVNATDAATTTLAGTVLNPGLTGGTVTVSINGGAAVNATFSSVTGAWSLAGVALPEGQYNIAVNYTPNGGSTVTTNTSVLVDRSVPTVTINTFAGNDVLNSAEAGAAGGQVISGTASLSDVGRTVNITLGGKTYHAVVQAGGTWSTTVSSADLHALGQGNQNISASLSDAAGNTGNASHPINVDTQAPLIQVDALLGNNVLNAADILLTQVLTGNVSGAPGQTIGLYLGDSSPIATAVIGADGKFSLQLTPSVLQSLNNGTLVFGLKVTDTAGNETDATLTVNKVVNQLLNLTVDSIFGDGTLSAVDATVAQTISGVANSVAGIGATVSLTLGGTTLSAKVGQDGKWAIIVPPSVLGLLSDGNLNLDIKITDDYGNTKSVSQTVTSIIHDLPTIPALTGIFGDGLLNVAEALLGQTVGGTLHAATGSIVTVTLGTKSYTSTVQAGGLWSVNIPPADLTSLLDGTLKLGVKVVDPAGNTASQSVDVGIFTQQPTISLSPIFGDGILNIADALVNQTISGVVNNVAAGTVITLGIGNSTVTATVGQNGAFSAVVSPDILGTLASGNLTVSASLTDAAGNKASTTAGLQVSLTGPGITLEPLFGDGLLNAVDALTTQLLTGKVSGVGAGAQVTVTVGGQKFVTTTAENGSYSLALTPAVLQGLLDGNLTVGVSVTDSAGNTASASAGAVVGIHNLPTINLSPIFGDGILSALDLLVAQTISGTIANVAAGTQVRINLGSTVLSATVGADGKFSATVQPNILGTLLDGNLTVGVSVTDAVGNTTSASGGLIIGAHTTPTVTLNTVFGDGVLSAADLATAQIISGSTTNISAGRTVTVSLGGKSYTTQVASNGTWSLSVSKADLALLANGTQAVNVSVSDSYGNPATKSGSVSVISQTAPTVSISSVFGDGALSAADALTSQVIRGTSTNAEGSTVTVKLGTLTLTGIVAADGSWSISVPPASLASIADGTQTLSASVTNIAGNSGSGTGSVVIGTHVQPTITLNNSSVFGGDHYLNLSEANNGNTLTGTATNAVGGTVSVVINGATLSTTVGANGSWSLNIPSATLKGIADGSYTLTVKVTDTAGNTASTSNNFTAITHNLPAVGVDPVLSLVSVLLTGLTISGGTLNLAQGSKVNITLNGVTQQATVDAFGRYSSKFSGGLLTALNLGSIVTVSAVDAAGNATSVSTTLLLGSLLPVAAAAATHSNETLSLFAVAEDNSQTTHHQTAATNSDAATAKVAVAAAAAAASSEAESSHAATSTTRADSTLTTDKDDVTQTAATGQADDTFTIGGVTLTLADGHTISGPNVTGGSGNDTVTVASLGFTHIDGGAGTDTLVLTGDHMQLDLTSLGLKVENIEILDLGKSGTNSVKLDLHEAMTITDSPQEDLLIKGADGSQVTLANTDGGVWATVGQRTVEGQVYDIYHNSSLSTDNTLGDVLIQHNLQVHVV
ncbi:hemagglutinin [Enterobacterales bacterium CwR94]|nr:hemagglutinin [Enterobacterales bacterium CwR94]